MRRSANGPPIALFPFLAVLLCAMGALILLLLILTRQIREDVLHSDADETTHRETTIAVAPPSIPHVEIMQPQAIAAPPVDPNDVLRAELASLNADRNAAASELKRLEQIEDGHVASVRSAEGRLASMSLDADAAQQRLAARKANLKERETEQERLRGAIEQALAKLDAVRVAAATAAPKVSIVPFDGQHGTARRPILVECTADAIRFLPEGVELSASDVEGFQPDDNPLLAGVVALRKHWMTLDGPGSPRPYVLLLVREDGIAAYYAARSLLSKLDTDTGYELMTASMSLELPDVDPAARDACRAAVLDALRNRNARSPLLAAADTTFPTGRFEVDPADHDPTRTDEPHVRSRPPGNPLRPPLPPSATPETGAMSKVTRSQASPHFNAQPSVPERRSLPVDPRGGLSKTMPSAGTRETAAFESTDAASSDEAVHGNRLGDPNAHSSSRSSLEPFPGMRRLDEAARNDESGGDRNPSSWQFGLPPSKQRWGTCSPTANIALERPVGIVVTRDAMTVGVQSPIPIRGGVDAAAVAAVFEAVEKEATTWGPAPGQFYWKPRLFAKIQPGGTGHFDRLEQRLESAGLRVSGEIVLESVSPDVTEWNHGQATP